MNFGGGRGMLSGGGASSAATGATVPPGGGTAASINAAIAAAAAAAAADPRGRKQVVTLSGIYMLEAPIALASNVIVEATFADLVPTFTGGADDPTNTAIIADAAINAAKMSTTLTASVVKNTNTVTVTAAGTIAAGDWILIEGANDPGAPQDALLESDGASVVLSEVIQIASVAGNVLTTAWRLRQHHGSNHCTVRAITPVVGAEWRGGRVWGSESVTTACAVYGRYAVDLTVDRVRASGCSRAAIETLGVRGFRSRGIRSSGNNNAWLISSSTIGAVVSDLDGDQGVARVHALGLPRYPILLRWRCTDYSIDDIHLTGTACGMFLAGGEHIRIGSLDVTDTEITQAVYDRMVAGGEIQNLQGIPMAFGSGYAPLAIAEFVFDLRIDSIRCEDMKAPTSAGWTDNPFRARAVYLHDILACSVGQVAVISRGANPIVTGVVISDFSGKVDSISVAGCYFGLVTENVSNSIVVDRYTYEGTGGNAPNSSTPFYLNHWTPTNHAIHFREVLLSNGFSGFGFGVSFVGDPSFRIDHLSHEGYEFKDVIVARNETVTAFSQGDIVEIDSTSTVNDYVRIITPITSDANYEKRLAVVASGQPRDSGTGYMMIVALPAKLATVKASTAVVNKGDPLKYVATRRCVADTAAVHPFGKAMTYKAAGAEGMIRCSLPIA